MGVQLRTRFGAARWKAGYALISLIGLMLVVHGYGLARQAPVVLWLPPIPMRHIAALLTALAFVLLAAACVPRNRIKSRLHHPMLLGVKVWALAHLLANGTLADLILFSSFLAWAITCFSASRRRDRHHLCGWHDERHAGHTDGRAGRLGRVCIVAARALDRRAPVRLIRTRGQSRPRRGSMPSPTTTSGAHRPAWRCGACRSNAAPPPS